MCTGGPRNSRNPQRAQPAQARQGRASAPCQRDPRTNRIPPACAGLHRSRGRSPHWAAKRGQAADMSELPLHILTQSPAPAFVISHAARHMAERWYPSSGRFRSPIPCGLQLSHLLELPTHRSLGSGYRVVDHGRPGDTACGALYRLASAAGAAARRVSGVAPVQVRKAR